MPGRGRMLALATVLQAVGLAGGCELIDRRATSEPPSTPAIVVADTIDGLIVEDPYRWLENDTAQAVRQWVAQQNARTDALLGAIPERQRVLRRIVELIQRDVAVQPIARGGRYFFMKRSPDQQRFAIYVRDDSTGVDRLLIDPYSFSRDRPPALSLLAVTRDGSTVTYSLRREGVDESEIRFFDVERRTDLPDRLPPGRYTGAEILNDRSGAYYARVEADGPRLRFHRAGQPVEQDSVVFGTVLGADRMIGSAVSEDGRWLGIVAFHTDDATTDVYLSDLAVDGPVATVVEGVGARFLPVFAGDTLLLHTDWNAPNGRVLAVPLADPRRDRWTEIVPEHETAVIEGVAAVGGRVLVNTLEDVQSNLDVWSIDGSHIARIDLPNPGSFTAITGSWSAPEAFLAWETFHVPGTIERLDVATGTLEPWFVPAVPIPSGLVVRQHWIESHDGTRVPLFLVHRDDIELDGDHAAILTGFGGFGASLTPAFLPEAVITAERGGVFAVVNARGGGELGEPWHDAGRGAAKPHAIEDFLAAAQWLIAQRYTSTRRLATFGTTHGGIRVAGRSGRPRDAPVVLALPPDRRSETAARHADRQRDRVGAAVPCPQDDSAASGGAGSRTVPPERGHTCGRGWPLSRIRRAVRRAAHLPLHDHSSRYDRRSSLLSGPG
jgi:prolyl oligopeptidase